MTEISHRCGRCGKLRIECRCPEGFCRYYTQSKPTTVQEAYAHLRCSCSALEDLLAEQKGKDLHRLDKAVTVMKVGFKMVKRVLRAQGATGNLKKPPEFAETVQ